MPAGKAHGAVVPPWEAVGDHKEKLCQKSHHRRSLVGGHDQWWFARIMKLTSSLRRRDCIMMPCGLNMGISRV